MIDNNHTYFIISHTHLINKTHPLSEQLPKFFGLILFFDPQKLVQKENLTKFEK